MHISELMMKIWHHHKVLGDVYSLITSTSEIESKEKIRLTKDETVE